MADQPKAGGKSNVMTKVRGILSRLRRKLPGKKGAQPAAAQETRAIPQQTAAGAAVPNGDLNGAPKEAPSEDPAAAAPVSTEPTVMPSTGNAPTTESASAAAPAPALAPAADVDAVSNPPAAANAAAASNPLAPNPAAALPPAAGEVAIPDAPIDRALQPKDSAQEPLNGHLLGFDRKEATLESIPGTLQMALVNQTTSANVFAYVTGQALDNGNALFLLQSDGVTPYYPTSPPSVGSPLQANVAIPLGAPGNTVTVRIPHLAGARLWFSLDAPLTFALNPGPALVEPSVLNQSDPNINVKWGFAEFTYNNAQLYANISSVDFVALPIAMTLTSTSGSTNTVPGLPNDGLERIAAGLEAQSASDGQSWRDLIVRKDGRILRILSPNSLITVNSGAFAGYYDPYTNWVWGHYYNNQVLQVQSGPINTTGRVENGQFNIGGELFSFPSTGDIFSSNSGPFTTGGDGFRNSLIPILAAAFNRSTLLVSDRAPAPLDAFYKQQITNHYSRILHETAIDGRGYAFPYDDVNPADGGAEQSGFVNDGSPAVLRVTVGGTS